MAISFPTSLDTLTNPASGDGLNSPAHATQHADANDILEALEAKVGVDSSGVATSLDYKVTNAASADPGHTHTKASINPYILVATLASDAATSNNTNPISLTNLVWTYVANAVYFFRFLGDVSPAASTTGCGFQLDVSSAITQISMSFIHQLATSATLQMGNSIADDASAVVTTGMPSTGVYPVTGSGMLRTDSTHDGTAQLRFRSETTAVTTCKAGFTLVVERVS